MLLRLFEGKMSNWKFWDKGELDEIEAGAKLAPPAILSFYSDDDNDNNSDEDAYDDNCDDEDKDDHDDIEVHCVWVREYTYIQYPWVLCFPKV